MGSIGDLLRIRPDDGPVSLIDVDPASTPGTSMSKEEALEQLVAVGEELADLQERLFANGRTGSPARVLVVLQGMDCSGKGGAVKKVAGLMNPSGMRITAFATPTEEELSHDFLWRIEKALPAAGIIGVFDRSHYEDVLIARVRGLVPQAEWEGRYDRINAWEADLAEQGVVLLKVMLHISPDEQRSRLLARLDDPTKHWKFNPGDVDERRHWHAYQSAYEAALERCSTDVAPWHVLPANQKWYRSWALAQLLLETLRSMDLQWPESELDVDALRAALSPRTEGDSS